MKHLIIGLFALAASALFAPDAAAFGVRASFRAPAFRRPGRVFDPRPDFRFRRDLDLRLGLGLGFRSQFVAPVAFRQRFVASSYVADPVAFRASLVRRERLVAASYHVPQFRIQAVYAAPAQIRVPYVQQFVAQPVYAAAVVQPAYSLGIAAGGCVVPQVRLGVGLGCGY